MIIRTERENDYNAIDEIHNSAFGHDVESALIRRLRKAESFNKEFSLVAEQDGEVIGHILFTPITVESPAKSSPAIILAPLAVLKEYRGVGAGTALVAEGIKRTREAGFTLMLVYGHRFYEKKFGFTLAHEKGIFRPNPMPGAVVRMLPLTEGGADGVMGVIKYPKEFRPLIEEWYKEEA